MGIRTQRIEQHWNYFLTIERDVDHLSRYVEFDERNFECFSIEIARVILASGAEVDVVCQQICQHQREFIGGQYPQVQGCNNACISSHPSFRF